MACTAAKARRLMGGWRSGAPLLAGALWLLACPPATVASADAPTEQVIGNWLTAKHDGIIQISQQPDGLYQGRIVGGDEPNRLDDKNPDPAKRGATLFGLIIMRDMKYQGAGHWAGGSIYDPDSGHTYHCRLELLEPDRLRVRGFLGVSLLGRSQLWTRYRGSSMVLPKT